MLPTILGISSGVHEYYIKILKKLFAYVNRLIAETNNIPIPMEEKSDIIEMHLIPKTVKTLEIVDICPIVTSAINAIVDDNVTKRFSSEELRLWNILKRSQTKFYHQTMKLNIIWWLGFMYRYFILLPNRLILFFITVLFILIMGILVAIIPEYFINERLKLLITVIICRMATAALSIKTKIHGKENIATHGICVSNHTTPLDAVILCSLRFFTLVGQIQGGFFGLMQLFFKKTGHIFFERSQFLDRSHVCKMLKLHVDDKTKPPIILFPEGTCINNTSVMIFRKGSFEIAKCIYPIAIKYQSMYGDAFWNSSKYGFFIYLIQIMSCWMIYCEIWFLPPVYRGELETDIEFAARVRHIIAKNANIVELDWDGNLKRSYLPPKFKKQLQEKFAKRLIIPYNEEINRRCLIKVLDKYIEEYTKNKSDDSDNDKLIKFNDDMIIGLKKNVIWKY